MPENIFVVGADAFNMRKMRNLNIGTEHRIHELLSFDEVKGGGYYPVEECLALAERRLNAFEGSIDAIVGYWDFPVTVMVPILCHRRNLPSPSLESVLRCEHKYWSRIEQRKVIPEFTPPFTEVDPFDDAEVNNIELPYPFWIKPIKGTDSLLAFKVRNRQDLREAIGAIRAGIRRIAEPFDHILSHAQLPEEISRVRGHHCIVEALIPGRQCTVEGYVCHGRPWHHGIVDSINYPKRSSFLRYQYPSSLPKRVKDRLGEATGRLMRHLGYDNATYNVEYFYQPNSGRIGLLEINPRLSQSHSDMFEKVDGASNFQIMVELALGREPDFPLRQGKYGCAAKFHVRVFEDGIATHVPDRREVEAIERQFPGTLIEIRIKPGMRLSDLIEQDSYSYDIAHIHAGAENQKALLEKYNRILEALNFEFAPVDAVEAESPEVPGIAVR
ncbi:ATP-grasp domain-containing protein [Thiohalobacter thiocyanaticus]|uniref:ATP-grasp domain-containing protein n=1 Tax=Thiohalobacter thiocyanaticus TaxID=585455 RepID=A0A426QIZ8_9GAMM|nr:ATP-grasp domain-containing protein [Thiohalobacter thiocyanaticus]RRQ21739.1 ATP-grasp domain-containing protein [Thiohalobacter thiocyanaticus]